MRLPAMTMTTPSQLFRARTLSLTEHRSAVFKSGDASACAAQRRRKLLIVPFLTAGLFRDVRLAPPGDARFGVW
jgi:hypothetical protein